MELKKSLQLLKKDFSFKHFIPMTNRTPRKINQINLDRTRQNSTGIKPYENIEKKNKKQIFPYRLTHKNSNIFIYPKIISRTNVINENQKNSLITSLSILGLNKNIQNNNELVISKKNKRYHSNPKELELSERIKSQELIKVIYSSRKKQKKILSPLSFSNNISLIKTQYNIFDIQTDIKNIETPEDMHIYNVMFLQKTKHLKYKFDNLKNEIQIGDEIN